MGPVLVSPSALGDPSNLAIKTTVNGHLVQEANTSQLLIPLAEAISSLSQGCTLEAGSLILTGSPLPLGRAEGNAPFLKHRDEVRVWVQGCGQSYSRSYHSLCAAHAFATDVCRSFWLVRRHAHQLR